MALTVLDLLTESLALARLAVRRAWPALLLPVVAGALLGGVSAGPLIWLVGGVLGLVAVAALLRAMADERLAVWRLGAGEVRLGVSSLLIAFLLAFVFVMTLLAVTLVVIGIMAGSGFDFDAVGQDPDAFTPLFAQYRTTPGWQLSQVVFLAGAAAWFLVLARALAFAAASIVEQRVVAMEAVKWSRGHGARLLAALGVLLAVPVLLFASVMALADAAGWPGWTLGAARGSAVALGLLAASALSMAAYRRLAPAAKSPVSAA